MKIKLLMPPTSYIERGLMMGMLPFPPFGLAELASFLRKKGYNIELDDLDIKVVNDEKLFNRFNELQIKYDQNDLKDYLQKNEPNIYLDETTEILSQLTEYKGYDLIGFSIIEASNNDFALLLSKKIKAETGCKIVFGGFATNTDLEKIYNFVDYATNYAPGEIKLLNFIRKIENKNEEKECLLPINQQPNPDFDGLPLSFYRNVPNHNMFSNPGKKLILQYRWSKGCPYKCSFCENSYHQNPVELKPHKVVVRELNELSIKYDTRCFFILNDSIHINNEYTINLCNEFIKQKSDILWSGCIKCNIDPSIIPLLSKAGFFFGSFGLESGSDKILLKMKKGYNQAQAENAIRATHNSNIWVALLIIVCFPHETEDDFNETFNFIHRNIEYIDEINQISPFLLINSDVLMNPQKYGIKIRGEDYENKHWKDFYAYDEIGGLSWEEIQEVSKKRSDKLHKLLFLYKKIPFDFTVTSVYRVFYAFDKYRDKKKVYEYLKDEYKKKRALEEGIVPIINKCDNNCSFCKKPNETFNTVEHVCKKVTDFKKKRIKKIVISGGEPTLNKYLFDIIKFVGWEGMEVKLNTNAKRLSNLDFCEKLYKSGLMVISVPVYSNKPEIHDRITKTPKSFEQTIKGIHNWKKIGGRVLVRTVLCEENNKNMSEFVDFILDLETEMNF